eukprot:4752369-Prymnesium_polylepis.2
MYTYLVPEAPQGARSVRYRPPGGRIIGQEDTCLLQDNLRNAGESAARSVLLHMRGRTLLSTLPAAFSARPAGLDARRVGRAVTLCSGARHRRATARGGGPSSRCGDKAGRGGAGGGQHDLPSSDCAPPRRHRPLGQQHVVLLLHGGRDQWRDGREPRRHGPRVQRHGAAAARGVFSVQRVQAVACPTAGCRAAACRRGRRVPERPLAGAGCAKSGQSGLPHDQPAGQPGTGGRLGPHGGRGEGAAHAASRRRVRPAARARCDHRRERVSPSARGLCGGVRVRLRGRVAPPRRTASNAPARVGGERCHPVGLCTVCGRLGRLWRRAADGSSEQAREEGSREVGIPRWRAEKEG